MSVTRCLVDGRAVELESWQVPGPGCGDGVFETIRVHDGGLTLAGAHFTRLRTGLARLGLDPAPDFLHRLERDAVECGARLGSGVLRVVVVAGSAGGYRRARPPSLHAIHCMLPLPDIPPDRYRRGVQVRSCAQRLALQPALAGIKHLNRLEQCLAVAEWEEDPDIAEGLMADTEGRLVEGTRSNLFAGFAGRMVTPRLDRCGVAGTMRALLLQQLTAAGVAVAEEDITPERFASCDEMFVCNSVFGVWPVIRCDEQKLAIGAATRIAQRIAAAELGIAGVDA